MRIKLTLEYDGSNYCGWQIQPGRDAIQERIEAALARIFSQPVRIFAAGRTDAGVHALGQVAAFTPPRPFGLAELGRALNALLPKDIAVCAVEERPDDFDPRRDARVRVYEYRVLHQAWRPALEYRYCWHVREALEMDAMNRAAALFAGEHDFAAFRTLGSAERSTVRRVMVSQWRREAPKLVYRVEATGFMRHMVRTMVAVMVAAGRGRLAPEAVAELLEGRNRAAAPAPAPPGGLFLVEVRY
jgi:tRNA pseudouridine38-40 synthase